MERTDVLVVGGSVAGIVAATTGKSFYPDKKFMVIRKEEHVLIPCGIPYIFGTLENSERNLVPELALRRAGIDLRLDEVTEIDQKKKCCITEKGDEISFDKLIIATGSSPAGIDWLKGSNLKHIYTVPKNKEYIDHLTFKLAEYEDVVIIGGGFIGLEVADEVRKTGKNVTIVELMPHLLSLAFDEELASWVEDILELRGIDVLTGSGVKEILGDDKVTGVLLENGEEIRADAVIVATGFRPNTGLAKVSGISINDMGFIKVNEYMQTENSDIYSVGDCAEKLDFFTGNIKGFMLASIASSEARIAGINLFEKTHIKSSRGTLPVFCTSIGEYAFGAAGITEDLAKKEGIPVIAGTFDVFDKHPATLPGAQEQVVKLIIRKDTGVLIGGEVIGGASTGELTNIIGMAIQNRMTVDALLTSQIGTHPLLTAPPTSYPVVKAAEIVFKKMMEDAVSRHEYILKN